MITKLKQLSRKRKILFGLLLLVVLGLLGFGGYSLCTTDWSSPEVVTTEYFASLKQKDYQKAYQLTGKKVYHESFKQFTERVQNYGEDMEIRPVNSSVNKENATVTLAYTVTTDFGKLTHEGTIDLIWEKGWRITNP